MLRVSAITAILALATPAIHAQVPGAAGRAAARAIAARSTTSAARAASALSSLGSGSSVAGARVTSVMGYLWAGEGTPISNATVQLRNIVTGQVEQVSSTLQNGAFAFNNVQGGTYAIEYVSSSAERMVAIGQAFSVAPGETVATFVRLGSELAATMANTAGTLVSNAASAVVSTAASTGITGTVIPEQAVSPLR
ncbi:MAG: carboxypeptidase-like regulatory domain-containing protein [Acidobacteriota bacterium]|nr:carboxypeptidase-like regulatory domain-containing protein [Acidobacteriota bacterium]